MPDKQTLTISADDAGTRCDLYLTKIWAGAFSRTQIKELFQSKQVTLKDKPVKGNYMLHEGDVIEVARAPHVAHSDVQPTEMSLEIVYEDDDVIVINKPAGLVVHPGAGNQTHTLANALMFHTEELSRQGGDDRPGIVHRLDKGTSGLLVAVKNDKAHRFLAKQFKDHSIDRVYWTLVKGVVQHDQGVCNEPIGRGVVMRKTMHIKPDGREAITHYRVLKRFDKFTLLEIKLETGRTHQIRVHMKHLGHPVVGDVVYGVASQWINRPALHAKVLGFVHPTTQKMIRFDSELPDDFQQLLKAIETNR